MKNRTKMILVSQLAIAFALVSPQLAGHAEDGTAQSAPSSGYEVSDGPVSVYGQTLNPQLVDLLASNYTWKDLKSLMPELLPDAHRLSLTAEEVCDRVNNLTDQYLAKTEVSSNLLVYRMESLVNSGAVAGPADLAVSDRLAANSPEALQELIDLMPDLEQQILEAKQNTFRSLAMILLHDAALKNCPAHAQEKGYAPYATYAAPAPN